MFFIFPILFFNNLLLQLKIEIRKCILGSVLLLIFSRKRRQILRSDSEDEKLSNLCSHSRHLGGINNSQDVQQTWISIIPSQNGEWIMKGSVQSEANGMLWNQQLDKCQGMFGGSVLQPSLEPYLGLLTVLTGTSQHHWHHTALPSIKFLPLLSLSLPDRWRVLTTYAGLYNLCTTCVHHCTGPATNTKCHWSVMSTQKSNLLELK